MHLKTKILKSNNKNIVLASELLKKNNIIGIPTETVYGLAGRADNDSAIKKSLILKKGLFLILYTSL